MDELTLNGEKYISSKRAAKITGYTKDYVGQLCREGKIIAQLVGRNWYVSEASIHKHRFELEDQSSQAQTTLKRVAYSTSAVHHVLHDSVRYSHDDANIIPLQKKEQAEVQAQKIETPKEVLQEVQLQKEPDIKSNALSTMQNTWQELFTTATHVLKSNEQPEEHEDIVNSQDTFTQPISVHKMSSVHLVRKDRTTKESEDTNTRKYFNHKISKVAHALNVLLMLIALIFFVVAILNIFLSTHTAINQLHYITGVSVYTAK